MLNLEPQGTGLKGPFRLFKLYLCAAFLNGTISIWVGARAFWCHACVLSPSVSRARPWSWFRSEPKLGLGLRPWSLEGPSYLPPRRAELRGRLSMNLRFSADVQGALNIGLGSRRPCLSWAPPLCPSSRWHFSAWGVDQPLSCRSLVPHPLEFRARPWGVVGGEPKLGLGLGLWSSDSPICLHEETSWEA